MKNRNILGYIAIGAGTLILSYEAIQNYVGVEERPMTKEPVSIVAWCDVDNNGSKEAIIEEIVEEQDGKFSRLYSVDKKVLVQENGKYMMRLPSIQKFIVALDACRDPLKRKYHFGHIDPLPGIDLQVVDYDGVGNVMGRLLIPDVFNQRTGEAPTPRTRVQKSAPHNPVA